MKFTIEIESDDPNFNWKEEVATILQDIVRTSRNGLHYQFSERLGFCGGLFDSKGNYVGRAVLDTEEMAEEKKKLNKG